MVFGGRILGAAERKVKDALENLDAMFAGSIQDGDGRHARILYEVVSPRDGQRHGIRLLRHAPRLQLVHHRARMRDVWHMALTFSLNAAVPFVGQRFHFLNHIHATFSFFSFKHVWLFVPL